MNIQTYKFFQLSQRFGWQHSTKSQVGKPHICPTFLLCQWRSRGFSSLLERLMGLKYVFQVIASTLKLFS
jgi:hypothetical protein